MTIYGTTEKKPIKYEEFSSLDSRPSAAEFGQGFCRIGTLEYESDGVSWANIENVTSVDSISQIPDAPGIYRVGGQVIGRGSSGFVGLAQRKQLTTIVIGNSIAAAMKFGSNHTYKAEQVFANALADNILKWPEVTATTRMDKYGCYGYGGQLFQTINNDIQAQVFTPLLNAGINVDVIIGIALPENDIAGSTSLAGILIELNRFISMCKGFYPGAVIVLATCRPSFTITGGRVSVFQAYNDYVRGLDDGVSILVYESGKDYTDSGATPKKTVVNGTIVSNVLTVSSVISGDLPLGIGGVINNTASAYISAMTTGEGGVGTYAITGTVADITPAQNIDVKLYTDATVHPTPIGSLLNAKQLAKCLKRLSNKTLFEFQALSNNPGLWGSNGTLAGGTTGTCPTNYTVTSQANSTVVSAATESGLRLTFSNVASSSGRLQLVSVTCLDTDTGSILPIGIDVCRLRCKIKIISGGEYINLISPQYRFTDNGVAGAATDFITVTSADTRANFSNGDELEFISPNLRSGGAGTLITRLRGYLTLWAAARTPANAQIVVDVLSFEYDLPEWRSGLVTINGATPVTISAGALLTTGCKIDLELKTLSGTPSAKPFVSAKTNGTSFAVTGTTGDTSIYKWTIKP